MSKAQPLHCAQRDPKSAALCRGILILALESIVAFLCMRMTLTRFCNQALDSGLGGGMEGQCTAPADDATNENPSNGDKCRRLIEEPKQDESDDPKGGDELGNYGRLIWSRIVLLTRDLACMHNAAYQYSGGHISH